MVDVALALAETHRLPYVQTVAGFGTVNRGLRLSRLWCRRLVATSPDLAQDLKVELGVPPDSIAVIPPGILTQQDSSRRGTTTTWFAWRTGTSRNIGTKR